jgi:intracellular septation protein A
MKPGYKTTEFWATIVMGLLAQFQPIAEAAGPKTVVATQAAIAAAYVLSRGVAKMNQPPAQ